MMNWNGVKITINKLEALGMRKKHESHSQPSEPSKSRCWRQQHDTSRCDRQHCQPGWWCVHRSERCFSEGRRYLLGLIRRKKSLYSSIHTCTVRSVLWLRMRTTPPGHEYGDTLRKTWPTREHVAMRIVPPHCHTYTRFKQRNMVWIQVWKDVRIKLSSMHARVSLCCKNCNNNYTSTVHLFIPRQIKKTW